MKATTGARQARRGDIYAVPLPGGMYGALQVLAELGGNRIEIATLDALFDHPPTAREVARRKVLRKTFGAWDGAPARTIVEPAVPWWAIFVDNRPPVQKFRTPCNSFGGWYADEAFWKRQWERVVAKSRRRRKPAGRGEVAIDLGAGPARLSRDRWRLWLGEKNSLIKLPEGPVDWSALDQLPELTTLRYRGADPGFAEYVRSRPALDTVDWTEHAERSIDFGDTLITDLGVDASRGRVRVIAPPHLSSLRLFDVIDRITIVAEHIEWPLRVHFMAAELPERRVKGLAKMEALSVWPLKRAELRRLARYRRLRSLKLTGAPGSIEHVDALAELRRLKSLEIAELWDLDGNHFPPGMPELEQVEIRGVVKDSVPALKQNLAGVPSVKISGARTQAWIDANLSNPFRGWEDDYPRAAKPAMKAWKTAVAAAEKAGAGAPRKAAQGILRALVDALNRVDEKQGLDTIQREEALEAFAELAERFDAVAESDIDDWFDAWRRF